MLVLKCVFEDTYIVDLYSDNMHNALFRHQKHVSTNIQDEILHEYIRYVLLFHIVTFYITVHMSLSILCFMISH